MTHDGDGDGDGEQPRRFKPGENFYVDIALDGPLPPAALVRATLRGPIGGTSGQSVVQTQNSGGVPGQPNAVRVGGILPRDLPAGKYGLYRAAITWNSQSPPTWKPKELSVSALADDVLLIVEEEDYPPEPPLPNIAPDRDG